MSGISGDDLAATLSRLDTRLKEMTTELVVGRDRETARALAQLSAQVASRAPLRDVQQWIAEHPAGNIRLDVDDELEPLGGRGIEGGLPPVGFPIVLAKFWGLRNGDSRLPQWS